MPRGGLPCAYLTTRSTCACSSTLLKNGKAAAKTKIRIAARRQRPMIIKPSFCLENQRVNKGDRGPDRFDSVLFEILFYRVDVSAWNPKHAMILSIRTKRQSFYLVVRGHLDHCLNSADKCEKENRGAGRADKN